MTIDPNQAFVEARDTYLAKHPAPTELDFTCTECKAEEGEPCRGVQSGWNARRVWNPDLEFHIRRQTRRDRARIEIQVEAITAGEAAYDAAVDAARDAAVNTERSA
jgi:hypothetical protein